MEYTLKRHTYGPGGTFGELLDKGKRLCMTCEDPDNHNKQGESCIPKGVYRVVRHGWEANTKVKFKRVWHILDVPGRSAILIHSGNTIDDTHGCVLVGTAYGQIGNKAGVVGSRDAIERLRKILPETFMLRVE